MAPLPGAARRPPPSPPRAPCSCISPRATARAVADRRRGAGETFTLAGRSPRALEPWKQTADPGHAASQPAGQRRGRTAGGHPRARAPAARWCAARCARPASWATGVSADQVIVQEAGRLQLPVLAGAGRAQRTHAQLHRGGLQLDLTTTTSRFTGPRSPVQKVSSPEDLFLRLVTCPGFGPGRGSKRARFEQSVMSAVKQQAERLMNCAGQADRLRLEEYFTSGRRAGAAFPAQPAPAPASARRRPLAAAAGRRHPGARAPRP